MLPIEAGCKAIITGGNYTDNLGKEVIVIALHDIETKLMKHNVWIISPMNAPIRVRTNDKDLEYKESSVAFSLERNLMRIDGGDFPVKNLQEDMDDLLGRISVNSAHIPMFLRIINDNNNLS